MGHHAATLEPLPPTPPIREVRLKTASPPPNAAAKHYVWLDALRGFAALSVLFFHLVAIGKVPLPAIGPLIWFHAGFWGVDLFFAISGAVMVISIAQLQARYGEAWRRPFWRRRVARVMPLYLLTCIAFVLFVAPEQLTAPDRLFQLITHLLMVHNWFPAAHGAINGPSWSLGVEMQFYALLLLIGGPLLRVRLALLLASCLLISLLWRFGLWWLHVRPEGADPGLLVFYVSTQLPGVLITFGGGMLAGRFALTTRSAWSWRRALLMLLPVVLAWTVVLQWILVLVTDPGQGLNQPRGLIALYGGVALAAGLSVHWALRAPNPGAALSRHSKRLGDLSYGIYLWHMGVLLLAQRWLADTPWQLAAVVVIATFALSALSWHWLERPVMRWARGHRSTAPAVGKGPW
ncbi:acyltransferase family protein [Pseudomarimonas arenosa]|uniref:Acyltransferase n=1 Tax=Pseudomarimonas arenosa TaxID=2774145 RepID=A0AAW3ZHK5_9GAMM|nr:acyltransferase [Pseudomarimonas arenosa]MBD8524900.1 acyltransferase [Pseudomarimonas arenosa]